MERAPYLSVVVTSRNDDHGGDLTRRTQLFIDGLAEQVELLQLPCELVIVEWNPPCDVPSLKEIFRWPKQHRWLSIRVITVPPEAHRNFRHSDQLQFFQMIAKNVGVRRARGEFVLVTNVDILFSDQLMHYIGQKGLQRGGVYRCDRYDVERDVPLAATHAERLRYCWSNLLRVHPAQGSLVNPNHPRFKKEFGLQASLKKTMARVERIIANLVARPFRRLIVRAFGEALEGYFIWQRAKDLFAMGYSLSWQKLCEEVRGWLVGVPLLHTNGCGDFLLMDRESWFRLKGSPELEIFSMNLDSLTLFAAHRIGIREWRLPPPMVQFHIEHGKGYCSGGAFALYREMNKRGVPIFTYGDLKNNVALLNKHGDNFWNGQHWGLGQWDLKEEALACNRETRWESVL